MLCTKAGYLTPDGGMPADPNEYFFREYIQPGVLTAKDIVGGGHCMTPRFLKNQLGRSLRNMGVDCVDVFYLHNPETQLRRNTEGGFSGESEGGVHVSGSGGGGGRNSILRRGDVECFSAGSATARDALQLAELVQIAQEIAGGRHRFRFVQLPFNLGMTEALTMGNQTVAGRKRTVMEAADDLDITLIASASLLQGQVASNLPGFVAEALGLENDAERALQFARSAPGITTALVGMSRAEHARANARLVGVPVATVDEFSELFSRGESA